LGAVGGVAVSIIHPGLTTMRAAAQDIVPTLAVLLMGTAALGIVLSITSNWPPEGIQV
jgi:hypothetical protein